MSKYKVIFKADRGTTGLYSLTWESECPVQITAAQVSRNIESSATFLQVKVLNVSSEQISSIAIESEFLLSTGETTRTSFEYLDVDIAPAAESTLKPQQLAHANVTACKLIIERADSPRGAWQSAGFAKPLPTRKELQLSPEALSQRAYALGSKIDSPAVRGSAQDHGSWWVCACGQVNVSREDCCACSNDKQALLENEDEAKLLEDANARFKHTYETALELAGENAGIDNLKEAIKLLDSIPNWKDAKEQTECCRKRLEEKKTAQRTNNRRIAARAASALAGIAAIAALAVFVVIPLMQYNEAVKFVDEAEYEAAVNTASEIGGIKKDDAQSLKREAQYQYATDNLDRENETTYEYLKDLSEEGYEDSSSLFDEYFSPKVEIALMQRGVGIKESDWSTSPVIAEMAEKKYPEAISKPYDIWVRAYCPISNTLEVNFSIESLTKSSTSNHLSSNSGNNSQTFYQGTHICRLEFGEGIYLKRFVGKYDEDEVAKRITAKGADGEILCEKELQSPDYAASHNK